MTFSSSQVPRAEQLNAMLRQTIQPYASSAARDTALAAVLKEGMLTYLEDTNTLTMYDGAAWVTVALTGSVDAGSLIGATLAAGVTASSLTSVGTLASLDVAGDLTVDTDTLHVDSTLNRVGVGTTTPAELLDIHGNANGQGAAIPTVRITNTDTTAVATDVTGSLEFFSKDASDPDEVSGYVRNVSVNAGTQFALTFGTKTNAASVVEAMRIDNAGNVGIGITAPIVPLHIADGTSAAIILDDTGGTKGAAIDSRVKFFAGGVQNGSVGYASGVGIMQLVNIDGPLYLQTDSADDILLRTSGTTRMTIDDLGQVGIGDTTPTSQLDVAATARRAFHFKRPDDVDAGNVVCGIMQIGAASDASNPGTADYWILFRKGDDTTIGSIRGTGAASVDFLSTSDATLKTDNGPVTEGRVGSIIDALQIHDFDWNEGTVANQIGLFAQEAIDVLPENMVAAPGEDEDGNYMPAGLDYSKIVPILIAECQFLRQRVAALEAT